MKAECPDPDTLTVTAPIEWWQRVDNTLSWVDALITHEVDGSDVDAVDDLRRAIESTELCDSPDLGEQ